MAKIIICNWKENPQTLKEALALAQASDAPQVIIAPPFPFLGAVRSVITRATLAAQDVSYEEGGAFTGAVSASQLASVGVAHVIVGHSERRRAGDTDDIVAKKMHAVLRAGMTPILCVGESRAEHDAGNAEEIIKKQLEIAFSLHPTPDTVRPIIAYEPVWAISTEPGAKPDTPQNAIKMIQYIKDIVADGYIPASPAGKLPTVYIYGGSVNEGNADGFLKEIEIGGALVGSASLNTESIKKIIDIAVKH